MPLYEPLCIAELVRRGPPQLYKKIAGCVNEYFRDPDKDDNILDKQASRASIHTGYRAVLDAKSSDETMVSNSPFNVAIFFHFSV